MGGLLNMVKAISRTEQNNPVLQLKMKRKKRINIWNMKTLKLVK